MSDGRSIRLPSAKFAQVREPGRNGPAVTRSPRGGRGGSNPPLCTRIEPLTGMRISRFAMALAAYVVLAVLAWTTITDEKLRLATLAVLALFAVKTIVRRKDVLHRDEQ